ncbi:Low-density lipoprotein receptor-related protein 1-like 5, partial [Homarus americanus]
VHMALIRRPGVTSEQLHKVRGGGRFLVGQNYNPAADLMFIEAIHGDLADFRFYDVALSLEDLRDFASCNAMNDLLYPIYEFELNMTHLKPSGDIELYQMGLEDICTQEPDLVMIIPERIDFETSLAMCNFFTGDIIIPTNPEENVAIYDKYEEFNNYCADSWGTSFWLGVVANHTNGGWTRVPERKPLIWADFLPGWMVPTEEHSCLAFVAINVKYKWAASPCNILQCPICNFTSTPKLHLRGLCDLSKFDRFYSPYDYYNLKPVLEGFFLSRMTWNNHTWLIKSRLDRAVEARMKSNKPNDYPFGLHTWDVKGDACGQDQVQLLLTSCGITDFTCSDGSCIKKIKRCDQEVDCPDNTDELNCDVINIPEGYSAQLAPPAIDSSQLSLHISLDITSIREFDILGFVVAVDITQSIKWRDARLVLRNLRQGNFPNEAKV